MKPRRESGSRRSKHDNQEGEGGKKNQTKHATQDQIYTGMPGHPRVRHCGSFLDISNVTLAGERSLTGNRMHGNPRGDARQANQVRGEAAERSA